MCKDLGNYTFKHTLGSTKYPQARDEHLLLYPVESSSAGYYRKEDLLEVPALAALDAHGDIVTGREAVDLDSSFSLKSVAIYRAIPNRSIIERLPGGKDLMTAVSNGSIRTSTMDHMLRQFLEEVRASALQTAKTHNLEIKTIVLTYPNYLCVDEKNHYFEKYLEYYEGMVRSVWGDDPRGDGPPRYKYETISEGQATAAYNCNPFKLDPYGITLQNAMGVFTNWNKQSVRGISDPMVVSSQFRRLLCSTSNKDGTLGSQCCGL